jgi:hypothetical protein
MTTSRVRLLMFGRPLLDVSVRAGFSTRVVPLRTPAQKNRAAISASRTWRRWIARWKRPCAVPWLVIVSMAAGATAGSDNSPGG